jgi:uncharacterized protein (TIGR04255 family)
MVAEGTPLPPRIEPDAIIEALIEIRFDAVSPLPEVLFGRLAELSVWRGFTQRTLPAYNMPAVFRDQDPNLRFVPVYELSGSDPTRAVRIGAHVLSYHLPAPYVRWAAFNAGAEAAIDGLFDKTEGLVVNRVGLRYINALTEAAHGISLVSDLHLSVTIGDSSLRGNLNLNFTRDIDASTQCTVRIATREFVQGQYPSDATAIVDIDVFTVPGFTCDSRQALKSWVQGARGVKNKAFMGLLTDQQLARLRRDQ